MSRHLQLSPFSSLTVLAIVSSQCNLRHFGREGGADFTVNQAVHLVCVVLAVHFKILGNRLVTESAFNFKIPTY